MLYEVITRNLSGEMPSMECDHRLLAKSGRYRWFRSRGKVVERDATGAPLRHAPKSGPGLWRGERSEPAVDLVPL